MSEALRIFLPNRAGWFFFLLLILFFFYRPLLLLTDGCTVTHVLSGLYFLKHHAPLDHMYFAAFSPAAKFVSTSVLSDSIFAAVYQWWHLNGLVAVSAIAIAAALTASYQLARERGLGLVSGSLLVCIAAYATTLHWSARPHVLSYFLFVAAYYLIFVTASSLLVRLSWLTVICLIWASIHGSYIFVPAMLACKLVGDLVAPAPSDQRGTRAADRPIYTLGTIAVCLTACCCNFSGGPSFLLYAATYTHSITAQGVEWQSIDFSLPAVWAFLVCAGACFALWTYAPAKPAFAEFAFGTAIFLLGLHSMRVMPYYALISLPLCAAQWQAWRTQMLARSADHMSAKVLNALLRFEVRAEKGEPNSAINSAIWIAVSAATACLFVTSPDYRINDFDPTKVPVNCTHYLAAQKAHGLVFTQDVWASYVYMKTNQPLFVNEYQDLFPKAQMDDYLSIFMGYPGWRAVLDKDNFRYVMLPHGMPVVIMLQQDPNWRKVCEDSSCVLLAKK